MKTLPLAVVSLFAVGLLQAQAAEPIVSQPLRFSVSAGYGVGDVDELSPAARVGSLELWLRLMPNRKHGLLVGGGGSRFWHKIDQLNLADREKHLELGYEYSWFGSRIAASVSGGWSWIAESRPLVGPDENGYRTSVRLSWALYKSDFGDVCLLCIGGATEWRRDVQLAISIGYRPVW